MSEQNKIALVTGLTGFVATEIALRFLQAGYTVRGTVRSTAKGEAWKSLEPQKQYGDRIQLAVVPDMLAKTAYVEAVKGVSVFLHVASPIPDFAKPSTDHENVLIRPAIEGSQNALYAALGEPTVEKFILTSSTAASQSPAVYGDASKWISPQTWNPTTYEQAIDPQMPAMLAYAASKALAEKAFWQAVETQKAHFEAVAILPGMVFGRSHSPVADPKKPITGTNEMLYNNSFKTDGDPASPLSRTFVSVKDTAEAHFQAAVRPGVNGKRLVVGSLGSPDRWIAAFKQHFPERQFPHLPADYEPAPSIQIDSSATEQVLGFKLETLEETALEAGRYFQDVVEQAPP
ncbi:uncharacterized protein L969DRAFT_82732 [Mixia osmundae IAM 14324]|uniref:NAD-dependent epimerase/dehydratase domain-containing protein n=1 Tax=Mixia osmundae (strain CBS 9802 / IAM 14324 / JCM 22182 / KY 12970) TaxID=764103 RepID=G7E7X5_MIXOS|nr:uncharacterized protein L969DRAFT_82732 [Mixia osmundae IAM 14324]KEI38536.1 hypothetical protein L969DRAFT_82732 [Mixia osmundae IAM 14324]GAA98935.1 hypothetical protein E5Q_05623 [Mixia osmundae IAM 14324]